MRRPRLSLHFGDQAKSGTSAERCSSAFSAHELQLLVAQMID